MKLLLLLVMAAFTLVAGCRSSATADDGIAFRTIARGNQSGLSGADFVLARNPDEWRALWKRHTATVLPSQDLPPVDFEHDMVICVLMGEKPTTGYEIKITRIEPRDDGYFVRAVGTTPAFGAVMPQVVSRPYHMVVVPRRAGTVTVRTVTHGPDTP